MPHMEERLHIHTYIVCLPVLVVPACSCICSTACVWDFSISGTFLFFKDRTRACILRCTLGLAVKTLYAALRVNSHR